MSTVDTKKLTESLTDPLDMVPDGQCAGCALFGNFDVVVPVI
ncbi:MULTISPECIES: hypothetical protein [Streptomyces]|nr:MULTISPECIES: hypothetical protein [unclassified Streptomyces]